jgi:hypothetical protein
MVRNSWIDPLTSNPVNNSPPRRLPTCEMRTLFDVNPSYSQFCAPVNNSDLDRVPEKPVTYSHAKA